MTDFWEHLDNVTAEFPDAPALGAQGLGAIAAYRMRLRGESVPDDLARYERGAAYASVTASPLLTKIIGILSQDVLVLKGPENSALYPSATCRTYGDLDLLVPDVSIAEQMLRAKDFHFTGDPERIIPGQHHDNGLILPGLALAVELHRDPGWLKWSTPPSNQELMVTSVPSVTGVQGARALPPTQHLLHLLSHAWRHKPYNSLIHLVDIELLRQHIDPIELNETATRWGLERVVAKTFDAIDRLIYRKPVGESPLERVWSRHLREHRSQTLAEHYAATWLKGLAAPTRIEQVEQVAADIRWSLSARPWQSKRTKAKRIVRGLASPGVPLYRHLSAVDASERDSHDPK